MEPKDEAHKQLKEIRENYLNEMKGELNDEDQNLLNILSKAIENEDEDEMDEHNY